MRALKGIKNVKVIGYPFAGGQGQSGVELTPAWLNNQEWFKNMRHVHYEEVKVTSEKNNLFHEEIAKALQWQNKSDVVEAKNIENIIASSYLLRQATARALQQGFYPIVVGGDHSQAIGSIAGLKDIHPDAKLIWMDAHIDANTPDSSPSGNAHGMPLAYLSGIVPRHESWKCVDIAKDLCYFGIRSYEDDELALIKEKNVLVFES